MFKNPFKRSWSSSGPSDAQDAVAPRTTLFQNPFHSSKRPNTSTVLASPPTILHRNPFKRVPHSNSIPEISSASPPPLPTSTQVTSAVISTTHVPDVPTTSTQTVTRPPVDPTHLSTRTTRKANEIKPSDLRPPVLAKHRIADWETPFSLQQKEKYLSTFPQKVISSAEKAIAGSTVDVTKETYAAGLTRFTQYCDELNIDENQRMPADKLLIAGFVGEHISKVSGSTISNWLSGLKAWHEMKGAPWCGDDCWIRMAHRTAHREGVIHKRKPRSPVTLHHLIVLHKALDFSIPFHIAVWAVAIITFWACRRLGETTIPSIAKFNPKFHVTGEAVFCYFQQPDGTRAVSFRIPWTKTTHGNGADVIVSGLINDPEGICGLKALALHLHLNVNKDVPKSYSLFGYIDEQGNPQHMVKDKFLELCFDIWTRECICDVLGHSFRIGGAVHLLSLGLAPEYVAAVSGWTSLAFLLYWRRIVEIVPVAIHKAMELEKVKKAIEDYRKKQAISNTMIETVASGLSCTPNDFLDD
ncbi:hypothetical protein D9758_017359 [Tetrapyrgos nigripes]|uniref:DNA breaking-rejoining enzyme n=1 Tax=Tetrapyrgos nigripes TaxID=182062 RepID=A0A8H5C4Q3_9AGAR|nr:hypothetical protein D9758_017359 [Tetrapyrgos nigripes]